MRATVITDASFCPRTKAAGWAAWIRIDGMDTPIKKYAEFKTPVRTAMQAEMLAAINGIWLAKQHGATTILLQTDCLAVVHMVEGRTKKQHLKDGFTRAAASAGILGLNYTARHVRGHTDVADARSYVNRWCDGRAKAAMRRQRVAA
ncbi:MAG: putative ribonuclease H [Prokaryotic dsDNA virus sp.]|nr:MAG: putative ribonuclease H [Prokaryotic dsDNA virus sp.]